jgi:hypothetical protein
MALLKQIGGAQIGWVRATWPLASIEVSPELIKLKSLGTFIFTPAEVISVEAETAFGIRIHHTKAKYPEEVYFASIGGRTALLKAISTAGFSIGKPKALKSRGFPLRIPTVVVFALTWNLLFLLDIRSMQVTQQRGLGVFALTAMGLTFALATILPFSPQLQAVFMRKNRDIGEVLNMLRLLQIVSGIMFLGSLLSQLAKWSAR